MNIWGGATYDEAFYSASDAVRGTDNEYRKSAKFGELALLLVDGREDNE